MTEAELLSIYNDVMPAVPLQPANLVFLRELDGHPPYPRLGAGS